VVVTCEIAVRLTRGQLIALRICAEDLEEFDRRFPDGVFVANSVAELSRLTEGLGRDAIGWLGPLAVDNIGDGWGCGHAYGYGYGVGGRGSGHGRYGNGDEDGSGSGGGGDLVSSKP
jgi:hypothetical protein